MDKYGLYPWFANGFPDQVAQNWQTDDLIHCRLRAAGARQVVLQPPCVTVHQNHRRHLAILPGKLTVCCWELPIYTGLPTENGDVQ